jgi:hypothetical protein
MQSFRYLNYLIQSHVILHSNNSIRYCSSCPYITFFIIIVYIYNLNMHSRKLYETAHISQPIWMRTDSLCVCLCMHTETEFDN